MSIIGPQHAREGQRLCPTQLSAACAEPAETRPVVRPGHDTKHGQPKTTDHIDLPRRAWCARLRDAADPGAAPHARTHTNEAAPAGSDLNDPRRAGRRAGLDKISGRGAACARLAPLGGLCTGRGDYVLRPALKEIDGPGVNDVAPRRPPEPASPPSHRSWELSQHGGDPRVGLVREGRTELSDKRCSCFGVALLLGRRTTSIRRCLSIPFADSAQCAAVQPRSHITFDVAAELENIPAPPRASEGGER